MNSPTVERLNGALWYSGPGTRWQSSRSMRNTIERRSGSNLPSCPATISFGRPVLPPEVGAFHDGATTSGNGASSSDESGTKPAGTHTRPGWSASSAPTTIAGSARSTIACRSRAGSLADTGWGTAPSFHVATVAS